MNGGLDPVAERFLANVQHIQNRLERAQTQLASGKRLNTASDDPDSIGVLLQVRADLALVGQTRQNLGRIKLEVSTAEQALQQAVRVLERARTLGAQAVNDTQTAASRNNLAEEVEALQEQLVSLARTSVDGRFLFSGDNDQVAPYTLDFSQPNGVSAYAGAAATRQTRHPSGSLFTVGRTAQQIFDSAQPSQNVFRSVNSLRLALRNNDTAAIAAALETFATAHAHLNSQLAFYGATENKVDEATAFASRLELRLKEEISQVEEADIAAAALELQQATVHLNAAMTARAKYPRTSLFDFL